MGVAIFIIFTDYFQSVTGDCEEDREAFDIHCDQL